MTRTKGINLNNIKKIRTDLGMNQTDFWGRYGVTQSAGSRYEAGQGIPEPLKALIKLHLAGHVTDVELAWAVK